MKIVCISVGKKHEPNVGEIIAEYEKRLKPFVDFSWEIIPSSDKDKESEQILSKIKDDDVVFLLDERGTLITNQQLAQGFELLQNQSTKRLVIIVGGAYGVSNDVGHRAQQIVSLSRLVLPHQLVRVIVVEQLYRSYSILSGGKYHHN